MKLSFTPHEHFLVNGCVIQNGDRRAELVFYSKAAIVRGKFFMSPENATTPLRILYLAVQEAYAGEERKRPEHIESLPTLFERAKRRASVEIRKEIERGEQFVHEKRFYNALRALHDALALE